MTTMTLTPDQAKIVEGLADRLLTGKEFGRQAAIAMQNERCNPGWMLTCRQYGDIISQIGRMATTGDRMAFVACHLLKVNRHGTAYQARERLYAAARQVWSNPFDDVSARSGPEMVPYHQAQRPWTLTDAIRVYLHVEEALASCASSMGTTAGIGWALAHLIEREGVSVTTWEYPVLGRKWQEAGR